MSERVITLRLGRQPEAMRYRTAGDWVATPDGFEITVADCGNPVTENLVGLHELVEVFLCQHDGVTTGQVDAYDLAHQDDDDPGLNADAPYHRQHMVALAIEILLANAFGINWIEHNDVLDAAWERIPEKT